MARFVRFLRGHIWGHKPTRHPKLLRENGCLSHFGESHPLRQAAVLAGLGPPSLLHDL